jgi:hypothetical protein
VDRGAARRDRFKTGDKIEVEGHVLTVRAVEPGSPTSGYYRVVRLGAPPRFADLRAATRKKERKPQAP